MMLLQAVVTGEYHHDHDHDHDHDDDHDDDDDDDDTNLYFQQVHLNQ